MFSKDVIDQVKAKADIVAYLERQGVALKTSGANLLGLCPFHNERSPSFNVRPGIQRYHCFGCGESGDIFNLVQHFEQLNFSGAVMYVADEVGVQVVSDEDGEDYRKLKRLYQIMKIASDWYKEQFKLLPSDHPAKQNFSDRNLLLVAETDPSVGFAPSQGLLSVLYQHRFSTEEAVEVGLAKHDENGHLREVFRNRIMWTVYDVTGKPIGFSGRRVHDDDSRTPKYLNSPQTRLYNKTKALLGLNFARKTVVETKSVYVVEGQTDVMALQAAGVQNVVASCGTAFGRTHSEILERLGSTGKKREQFKFFFCFDGDSAGVKAAKSVFNNIPEIQLTSYVIPMNVTDPTTGETLSLDPCDLRIRYGDQMLLETLQNPVTMIEFILKEELKDWDLSTPEGRSGFVAAASPTLGLIQDKLAHEGYLRKIAYWTGIPYTQIVDTIRSPRTRKPSQQAQGSSSDITAEDRVIAHYLQYPDITKAVFTEKAVDLSFFTDQDRAQKMFNGNLEEDPLNFLPLKAETENLNEHETDETTVIVRSAKNAVENWLRAQYLEAVETAKSNHAENINGDDETALLSIVTELQSLKKKYSQR